MPDHFYPGNVVQHRDWHGHEDHGLLLSLYDLPSFILPQHFYPGNLLLHKDWHGPEDHGLQLSLYALPSLPLLTVSRIITSTLTMWYGIRTCMVLRIMVVSY